MTFYMIYTFYTVKQRRRNDNEEDDDDGGQQWIELKTQFVVAKGGMMSINSLLHVMDDAQGRDRRRASCSRTAVPRSCRSANRTLTCTDGGDLDKKIHLFLLAILRQNHYNLSRPFQQED